MKLTKKSDPERRAHFRGQPVRGMSGRCTRDVHEHRPDSRTRVHAYTRTRPSRPFAPRRSPLRSEVERVQRDPEGWLCRPLRRGAGVEHAERRLGSSDAAERCVSTRRRWREVELLRARRVRRRRRRRRAAAADARRGVNRVEGVRLERGALLLRLRLCLLLRLMGRSLRRGLAELRRHVHSRGDDAVGRQLALHVCLSKQIGVGRRRRSALVELVQSFRRRGARIGAHVEQPSLLQHVGDEFCGGARWGAVWLSGGDEGKRKR